MKDCEAFVYFCILSDTSYLVFGYPSELSEKLQNALYLRQNTVMIKLEFVLVNVFKHPFHRHVHPSVVLPDTIRCFVPMEQISNKLFHYTHIVLFSIDYCHHVYLFSLFVNQIEDQILFVNDKPKPSTADDPVFGDSSRIRKCVEFSTRFSHFTYKTLDNYPILGLHDDLKCDLPQILFCRVSQSNGIIHNSSSSNSDRMSPNASSIF